LEGEDQGRDRERLTKNGLTNEYDYEYAYENEIDGGAVLQPASDSAISISFS
jgi:hypothetical protein